MSSQWNTKAIGKSLDLMQSGVLEEEVVILLLGKNNFGDRIYSFLKLKVKDLMRMQSAMQAGEQFNPSDFGSIVAAGKGEPTDEIKAEIASSYKFVNTGKGTVATQQTPVEEKKWDEY